MCYGAIDMLLDEYLLPGRATGSKENAARAIDFEGYLQIQRLLFCSKIVIMAGRTLGDAVRGVHTGRNRFQRPNENSRETQQ
jgi:hypothetical protein